LPANRRMYGSASMRVLALSISSRIVSPYRPG
jgi:hypothetical protein